MVDKDQGPSLEMPALGLRRRKKAKPDAPEAPEASEPLAEPEPFAEPEAVAESEPVIRAEPEPVTVPEPVAQAEPEPVAQEPLAQAEPEPTVVAPVEPKRSKPRKPAKPARPARERSRWIGAALIGLLSGIALVGLINATLRACDAAQGTSSCGGPGLFVLLVILALITVGATRLLRMWGFSDGGTVAFLGMALTAIVALVFLTGQLLSVAMVLVIPVVTALTFIVGEWLSSTMAEANQS